MEQDTFVNLSGSVSQAHPRMFCQDREQNFKNEILPLKTA